MEEKLNTLRRKFVDSRTYLRPPSLAKRSVLDSKSLVPLCISVISPQATLLQEQSQPGRHYACQADHRSRRWRQQAQVARLPRANWRETLRMTSLQF